MPTYSDQEGDPDVIRAAYAEARKRTNNPLILLALFESGLVESGFHNLSGGDRDSQGFLQQRPSQGWRNPTNVAAATDAFIAKAERVLTNNPSLSAGDLAQKVQVSGYPERYGQAQSAASSILTRVSGGKITGSGSGPGGGDSPSTVQKALAGGLTGAAGTLVPGADDAADAIAGAATDPISLIAKAIAVGLSPLKDVGSVAQLLFKASVPTTLIRIVCGIAGLWFLFFGVVLLSREMRTK